MVVIGVIYLTLEKRLLPTTVLPGDSVAPAENVLSRTLLGVQVRMTQENELVLLIYIDWFYCSCYGGHEVKCDVLASEIGTS